MNDFFNKLGQIAAQKQMQEQAKHNHKEAFCHMQYSGTQNGNLIQLLIWNSRDGVTPFCFPVEKLGITVQHVNWRQDVYDPNNVVKPGDLIWRDYTQEEAEQAAKRRCQLAVEHGYPEDNLQALYEETVRDIIDNKQPKLDIVK